MYNWSDKITLQGLCNRAAAEEPLLYVIKSGHDYHVRGTETFYIFCFVRQKKLK